MTSAAGQYNVPAGLGRQVHSTKKSAGGVRFGSAGRDAAQKIYLSPEHDRAGGGGGSSSPGPTTSNPRPAYGPQHLSRHARCLREAVRCIGHGKIVHHDRLQISVPVAQHQHQPGERRNAQINLNDVLWLVPVAVRRHGASPAVAGQ